MKITDSIDHQELIGIINRLSKKKKAEGLTAEEQELQKAAYQIYLKRIRAQFDGQLDNVKIKTPDGKLTPFKEYGKEAKK